MRKLLLIGATIMWIAATIQLMTIGSIQATSTLIIIGWILFIGFMLYREE